MPKVKLQNFFTHTQIEQLLKFNKPEYKSCFVTTIIYWIKHIDVDQVAYFYADNNTVYLIIQDKKKYIINYTLDRLDDMDTGTNSKTVILN